MKRILASLLILLWPLAFAPKAFATRGGSPDSRLKPLTLKGTGWVSDTEYLLGQSSEDDQDRETSENAGLKSVAPSLSIRSNTPKKGSPVKAHFRQPSRAANSARPTR